MVPLDLARFRVGQKTAARSVLCGLSVAVAGLMIPASSTSASPQLASSHASVTRGASPLARSAGVSAGTALRIHRGDLTVRKPGAVIDGVDVRGQIVIAAPHVTIRRSVIRGAGRPRRSLGLIDISSSRARNFTVEDVTISPSAVTPNFDGVKVRRKGTLRRLDVSGTVDGIVIYGGKVRVEDSYLHDFRHFASDPNQGGRPSHDDAIQVLAGRGHRIVGNTMSGASNAAVMITQDRGATGNLLISNNSIDDGGCSVNFGSDGRRKSDLQVVGNRFGDGQRVAGCAIVRAKRQSPVVAAVEITRGI